MTSLNEHENVHDRIMDLLYEAERSLNKKDYENLSILGVYITNVARDIAYKIYDDHQKEKENEI
jgi:hypothetical protein